MASIPPGTVIGNYRIIRELNRGGTAVVYEADDVRSGAKVALKVMSSKQGKAALPLAAIRREVEYAQRLGSQAHPNVVQLLDYFMEPEQQRVAIAWEIIEGHDLLDKLNECGGRMEEQQAAAYFVQLLRGVSFIHANGLCHRDLKPENCMVSRSGQLKVIDFGLSKRLVSAVTLGVGTPDYLAPELLGNGSVNTLYHRTTGKYDATATDVWAMGVMLYLLTTGQYPFEDPLQPTNVVATLQNISLCRYRPFPRRLSPACADLLRSMLNRDPASRITLPQIAAHPWLAQHGFGAASLEGTAQRAELASTGTSAGVPAPACTLPPPPSYETAARVLASAGAGVCVAADEVAEDGAEAAGPAAQLLARASEAAQQAQQGEDVHSSGACPMEVDPALPLEESEAHYLSAESSLTGPAPASAALAHTSSFQGFQPAAGLGLGAQGQPRPLAPKPTPAVKLAQHSAGLPPLCPTCAPGRIAAVRPPTAAAATAGAGAGSGPMVPVLVESEPGAATAGAGSRTKLVPLIPAQSLDCSPSAKQASKRASGLCRFWLFFFI